jgi:putative ABC transport system permease protein
MNFVLAWETKLSSLPGVEAVGATSHLPLDDYPNWYSAYRPAEIPAAREGALLADHRCVTPGYFRAMGTRLIEGRDFDGRDSAIGQETAIVDEMLAREAWPGESAIGKQIESEHFTARGIVPVMATIVGVVEHTRNHSLTQNVRGEIYLPYPQSVRSHLSFAVRTAGDPLALAGAIGRGLREKDRDLALSKMRPMTTYVERALAPASFTALLAAVFAMLAVTLAAIGVYGVVYYSVSQRMHEMGVRAALGASAADLRKLVARQGLTLTATGTLLGLAGSLGVARFLRGLVYGVPVLDPLTYAVALAVISAAALAGCWRPASKAAAANPVDAIRAE